MITRYADKLIWFRLYRAADVPAAVYGPAGIHVSTGIMGESELGLPFLYPAGYPVSFVEYPAGRISG